jgi:excisionase family DNA binding protein
MPKKPSPNLIKKHRVYDVYEAAEALGLHRQTIVRWIKDRGLLADTSTKPWLIRGVDLKSFLGERRAKGKCKLALHQIYCLPCRAPQTPDGLLADYRHKTPQTGSLAGLCPSCGRLMFKAIRRADLETIRAKLDVTVQQADARIVSQSNPSVTVTKKGHVERHVKTYK